MINQVWFLVLICGFLISTIGVPYGFQIVSSKQEYLVGT